MQAYNKVSADGHKHRGTNTYTLTSIYTWHMGSRWYTSQFTQSLLTTDNEALILPWQQSLHPTNQKKMVTSKIAKSSY
jgi:hypothetical protein